MIRYIKAIAAVLGAIATWGITVAADGVIDLQEWFGLLAALSTGLLVFASPPNGSSINWDKEIPPVGNKEDVLND